MNGRLPLVTSTRMKAAARPRSPSHAAKNKTPSDRVWEFGRVLGERGGRLLCRPCNLALDHTRRSTIVEHLRSRKHQRFLEEVGVPEDAPLAPPPPPPSPSPAPPVVAATAAAAAAAATNIIASAASISPAVLFVDVGDDPLGDHQRQSPSPTHSSAGNIAGLVGPYLLKKETHCSTVLDQLMRDDTFTDVTLTAQGQSLRAHRIVLCLASSYFRQVLSRDMGVQSVIVLRDIKFSELRNIIHFIYTGEATVDASELESFMRTAELLEISSLCEGQKCITGRSPSSSNNNNTNLSSSFSVGDFERLVGTKRPRKDTSPTHARSKARRHSGEGGSSRCSSTEPPPTPTTTNNSLSLVKEEPDCDITPPFTPIITSVASASNKVVTSDPEFLESDNQASGRGGDGQPLEVTGGSERSRRDSTGSVGGFAAIAGVQQKMICEEDGEDDPGEVFSPASHPTSPAPAPSPSPSQGAPSQTQSPALLPADATAAPGRCPYCPHISHKFEGVAMMRHLLVSHPCKPAYPCDTCWRVFVKRVGFKAHQQICQQQQLGS